MFSHCSGNSVIRTCTVCITLLNIEDVPTVRSISISQILVLPDTTVIVLSISQFLCPRQFPRFTTVSSTLHTFSATLITPPTVIISDPTESRLRNRGIAPEVAAVAWHISPRVVWNAFLERTCCFCSVFVT